MTDLLTCGASGPDGGGCGASFNPTFQVVLPPVGIPQITFTIPDFTGITIEAILKALELLGINPCAFIDALLGGIQDFVGALEDALQASIDASAQLPAQIINTINREAQQGLNDMFSGIDLDLFSDPCAGLVGAANETMTDLISLDSDFRASQTP